MAGNISILVDELDVSPIHVAADVRGNVFAVVATAVRLDQGMLQATQPRLGSIHHYAAPTGALLSKWGSQGTQAGQFQDPRGIAVDPQGNVYVADMQNRRIQKISPFGTPLAQWGGAGFGSGRLRSPWGLALGPDEYLYVSDPALHRIQVYRPDGSVGAEWGKRGSGPGEFLSPQGLAVDRGRTVYVADSGNNRIQRLSTEGVVLGRWGGAGPGPGQLRGPLAVAVDERGNLFVADGGNFRVLMVSPTGEVLATWAGGAAAGGAPSWFPADLTFDPRGAVYVADPIGRRILKLTPPAPATAGPSDGNTRAAARPPGLDKPAHEILGVAEQATLADIVAAYRKLARQYHPDRVADLGPEFGELATKRMKQINAAYEYLRRRAGTEE